MTHRPNCIWHKGDRINAIDTNANIVGWWICTESAIQNQHDGKSEFWKRRADIVTEAGIRD